MPTYIPKTQALKVCLGKGPPLPGEASRDVTAITQAEEHNRKHVLSLSQTSVHRRPGGHTTHNETGSAEGSTSHRTRALTEFSVLKITWS